MSAQEKPKPLATGSFSTTPFSHILIYLAERRLSGTLEVSDGKNDIVVFFREGMPAKVKSSIKGKGLGQILLELGRIDNSQLRTCQEEMNASGGYAGEILIRQGAIDASALIRGLRGQILLKLMDLFCMQDASYSFFEKVNTLMGEGPDELFPIDHYPVLMAGARTHSSKMNTDHVLSTISGRWISLKSPDNLKRFKLTPPEQKVCLNLLAKPRTVEELVENCGNSVETTRSVIYTLLLTKEVVISSTPPESSETSRKEGTPPKFESLAPAREVSAQSDPQVAAQRAMILDKASTLAKQNYYEMLELPMGAPAEEVRRAFFKLAKIYHPDRASGADLEDLTEALQYIFSNLSEAQTTLLDPDARDEYIDAIGAGLRRTSMIPEDRAQSEVRDVLEAEKLYQKGLVLMRRKQYDKSLELVEKARNLNPKEGEYLATWARLQAHMRNPTESVEDLVGHLRRAEELAPKSEKVHMYMGEIFMRANRQGEAKMHFKKALETNPHNIEAARELRLMELRKSKENEKKKGFFSRFLK